jgi:signal peptide peptidase SppA
MNPLDLLKTIDFDRVDLGVLAKLMRDPLLMDESAMMQRLGKFLASAKDGSLVIQAANTEPRVNQESGFCLPAEVYGEIAILKIEGVISPYGSKWSDDVNPYSLRHDARHLLNDDRITTVILYIDSPGGTANGLELAVESLLQLGEQKRLLAWNNDLCASAAYWLALSAEQIYAQRDSQTGSIGTYIALPDFSNMFSKIGVEMFVARDGDFKGLGLFGKPLTEEERGLIQERVMDVSDRFKGFVSLRRPFIAPESMRGQTFAAPKAEQAKLIDGIFSDFTEFFAAVMEMEE